MTHRPLIKHQKSSRTFLYVVWVVLFLILVIGGSFIQRAGYPVVTFITTPFLKAGILVRDTVEFFPVLFKDKSDLYAENERLKNDLQIKELELVGTRLILSENEALKTLLEREGGEDITAASVLSKPDFSPYDTVIVDVGAEEGIEIGDKAIYGELVVVGEVEAVYTKTSRIKFFSSPGEKHPVLIGESGIEAEAEGLGGGNFEVILPRSVSIAEGDVITLPEVSDKVFGIVERVGVGPSDTFQKILFKNPMNINELRFIGIISHE